MNAMADSFSAASRSASRADVDTTRFDDEESEGEEMASAILLMPSATDSSADSSKSVNVEKKAMVIPR
ncbi:hypothetical protein [Burkholderia cepacia]|uniref:hypothetical protein n=1 Tax=Burkholderia cepacia TaxID=292 RepID=UPI001F4296CF|nr:hypothetical protein [Burkholderia cepacia]MCE4129870.1 hypothetical protein [Burkholderia cepacia]